MLIRFWGTRGSVATPGPATTHFGGNTSCVEVRTDSGEILILDCGTGARLLGLQLMSEGIAPLKAHVLLTHTHWDHIQGFPFFVPLFAPGNEFAVYAPRGGGRSLGDTLAGQMEFNYFPVELEQLPSKIRYEDIGEGTYQIGSARVLTQYLNHPAMTLAYRVEADGAAVVYACDHEMYSGATWIPDQPAGRIDSILHEGDRRFARFLSGADLVIADAQYTPEEYAVKRNWGHATYEYAVEIAVAAGVKRLALTHHDPLHDDSFVREIQARARRLAARYGSGLDVFCAFETCTIELHSSHGRRVAEGEHAAPSEPAPHDTRVLLIDDDPELRALVKIALKSTGFITIEAGTADEGLRLAREQHPDLVLLDLLLPERRGLEAIALIRAIEGLENVPIMLLTAFTDSEHTRAGFEAGCSDYLHKPFTIPQLLVRIRATLARAAAI